MQVAPPTFNKIKEIARFNNLATGKRPTREGRGGGREKRKKEAARTAVSNKGNKEISNK